MVRYAKETAKGIEVLSLEDVLYSSREIFLTGEVSPETSVELMKELMVLEKLDSTKEVTLYINSPGGDVISGMAVYDYIQMMKAPVKTVCIGTAASMGAMLFLAGDKREMLSHTRLMIHDPAYGGGNMAGKKPHELQQYVEKLKQTQDIIVDIIAKKTGRTRDEIRDKTKDDSYFNAEEAIEYGLATGIVGELNDNLGNENLVLS